MSSLFPARCSLLAAALLLPDTLPGQIGSLPPPLGAWTQAYNHPFQAGVGWPNATSGTYFEAINMAVIPNLSPQGVSGPPDQVVIAWDNEFHTPTGTPSTTAWNQRFTVGNPETGAFSNRLVTIPLVPATGSQPAKFYGDLFCSGHVWLPNGKLFVAGGCTQYSDVVGGVTYPWLGSKFVGFWDPSTFTATSSGWDFLLLTGQTNKEMRVPRWYPTVTLLPGGFVMVAGGSANTSVSTLVDPASTTYEVFNLNALGGAGDWIRDQTGLPRLYSCRLNPTTSVPNPPLDQYPVMHLLSNNRVFLSGQWWETTRVTYPTDSAVQNWSPIAYRSNGRNGAPTVLVPNVGNTLQGRDELMTIGGGISSSALAFNTSYRIAAAAANPTWSAGQSLSFNRMLGNAVLVPNGDVVLIGGCSDYYFTSPTGPHTPVLRTEVWDKIIGWQQDGIQVSTRMYHSTAALLPSGRLVSSGSDYRTKDWEIYEPRYMTQNQAQPQWAGAWALPGTMSLAWDTRYLVDVQTLPTGIAIRAVVLMRPGSTTHNTDMDQRYIELQLSFDDDATSGSSLYITTPKAPILDNAPNGAGLVQGAVKMLPGYYMAFLVSSEGRPSQAKWVKL